MELPTTPEAAEFPPEDRKVGRRAVLGMLGLGAAGIVWGSRVQSGLDRVLRPLTLNDQTGLASLLPTAGRFRIYSVTGDLPSRSEAEYRLTVDGHVERPATFDLADVRSHLPQTSLTKDFQCVTGWRVDDVPWEGVQLHRILDQVGVRPGATHVRFHSFDGVYTETLTMEQARRDDVLVAHRMLDRDVTREHGGPVRLYVAPMYGYKSCKWLERIEVADELDHPRDPGYWEGLGYDVDAWVGDSNGRDDRDMTTSVDELVDDRVVRFDRTERLLHWANAALFLTLLLTGMTLYVGSLAALVGRRVLVKDIHVVSGLLLPGPLLLAYAGKWRDGLRRDVRRLARWSVDDRRWLVSLGRRGRASLGKFNAGQKANAVFVVGCIPVMLATGSIMRWFDPFPLSWRTGATFVHDWTALALLVVVVGHIGKALLEPVALRAMVRGTVPTAHVERHHPRWWAELAAADGRVDRSLPSHAGAHIGGSTQRSEGPRTRH